MSIIWQEKTVDASGDGRITLKQYIVFLADIKKNNNNKERYPDYPSSLTTHIFRIIVR